MNPRYALALLPPALLLASAVNHLQLVQRYQLSPWLGGGFGMFASTDAGTSRLLVVSARKTNGGLVDLSPGGDLSETAKRARGLPDPRRLTALADEIRADLDDGLLRVNAAEVAALTIEVWRTDIEPGSLRPSHSRVAVQTFELSPP